jgi:hypothetical protein
MGVNVGQLAVFRPPTLSRMMREIDQLRRNDETTATLNQFHGLERDTAERMLRYAELRGLTILNEAEIRAYYSIFAVIDRALPLWAKAAAGAGIILSLAALAFGFHNVLAILGGIAHLPLLVFTHDGIRIAAFAVLGLISICGAIWSIDQIGRRYTRDDIGFCLVLAGIIGGLVSLGGQLLGVDFGSPATGLVGLCSVLLFIGGCVAFTTGDAASRGRTYHRKADTIHGDARSADDWEIDEALRDRTGGFGPMFKD